MEQDRAGYMDTGEEEQLQSSGRGEQEHHPSVPGMLGGGHADHGQRRDVEFEGGLDGEGLFRPAAILQRALAGALAPRRVQSPRRSASLWNR